VNSVKPIPARREFETGNVEPLLHEIRHALDRLSRGEDGSIIDLQSMPLAPGEEKRIEEALGQGEVSITIDALGPTTVQETAYPGVWLVTHRNTENAVVARLVEITKIPALVMAQDEDIRAGLARLDQHLSGDPE
jgi:hydrogenase-1 operon protein HyaF